MTELFRLCAKKVILEVNQREVVTSNSVNVYQCQFQFDDAWDGLERTAVFQAGDNTVATILDETGICIIPWEVLQDAKRSLYAGVYGTKDGDGEYRISLFAQGMDGSWNDNHGFIPSGQTETMLTADGLEFLVMR